MKKLLILFIPLLFGCSLSNDAYVSITFSDSSSRAATAIEDLGSVSEVKLYISEEGKDFYLSDQEIVLDGGGSSYVAVSDAQVVNTTSEELPVADYDVDSEYVWMLTSSSNSLSFYIQTGLVRVFTVKVTYDTGEIFMGSSTRAISSTTTEITIDVVQTEASIAESTFDELDDFLQNEF